MCTPSAASTTVRVSEAAGEAKHVVVIGAGFIGMEAAAFLTKRGLSVTVLAREEVPFAKRFGEAVGAALKQYHAGNGVAFAQGSVARIEGGSRVEAIETKEGRRLPADLVLVGAGAEPETGIVAGVEPDESGGLPWAATCASRKAFGSQATSPPSRSGRAARTARIEHWRLAQQHGTHVAQAILGHGGDFSGAPFFWSNQGDKRSITAATPRASTASSCRAIRPRSISSRST